MEETNTVIGVNIVTGKEDEEGQIVTFSQSKSEMTVLIEGFVDSEGNDNVTVTASGPAPTGAGIKELGEILVGLGTALASDEMADRVAEATGAEDGE